MLEGGMLRLNLHVGIGAEGREVWVKPGDCCLFITMDIMSMETFSISYRMIIFSMESLGDKIRWIYFLSQS